MARHDNSRTVVFFIAGLFMIALAMIATIFVSTRRPVVVVVPGQETEAVGPPGAGGLDGGTGAPPAITPLPTISLVRTESIPAIDNPLDPAWDQISVFEIPLEMQQTSEPMLTDNTVPMVNLQTAYNGDRFVWRLSWEQVEPSFDSNVAEFSDAVALQFPLKDGAPLYDGRSGHASGNDVLESALAKGHRRRISRCHRRLPELLV